METMIIRRSALKKRPGMVLVVALLLMAIMSIIGVTALTTSQIDIGISHNVKVSRQAFYFSDGGVEQSPKYIRQMVDDGALPVIANVNIDAGLLNEIMGYTDDQGDQVFPTSVTPDISTTMGNNNLLVDIDRIKQKQIAGSGVEFGAGAEGAGVGSQGGVLIFYTFDSYATSADNAASRVDVYYRFVVGVAGGK